MVPPSSDLPYQTFGTLRGLGRVRRRGLTGRVYRIFAEKFGKSLEILKKSETSEKILNILDFWQIFKVDFERPIA